MHTSLFHVLQILAFRLARGQTDSPVRANLEAKFPGNFVIFSARLTAVKLAIEWDESLDRTRKYLLRSERRSGKWPLAGAAGPC
ncbi:MAG: hypothetical protein KatS3mg105_3860 [Gemmatales bacterium]|nr:MAG: hypothetical protein KatS3mg105_3860 [Gemmatales bacterium]